MPKDPTKYPIETQRKILNMSPSEWESISEDSRRIFEEAGLVPASIEPTRQAPGPLGAALNLQFPNVPKGEVPAPGVPAAPVGPGTAKQRVAGFGTGAASGAAATPGPWQAKAIGGLVGGTMGAAFPPQTPGQHLGMAVGMIPGGRAFNPMMKKLPGVGSRILAGAGLGGAETQAAHATQQLVDKTGESPFIKPGLNRESIGLGLGMALPAAGGLFTTAPAATSPVRLTRDLMRDRGQSELSTLLQPAQRRGLLDRLQTGLEASSVGQLRTRIDDLEGQYQSAKSLNKLAASDPSLYEGGGELVKELRRVGVEEAVLQDKLFAIDSGMVAGKTELKKLGLTTKQARAQFNLVQNIAKLSDREVIGSFEKNQRLITDKLRKTGAFLNLRGKKGRGERVDIKKEVEAGKQFRDPSTAEPLPQTQAASRQALEAQSRPEKLEVLISESNQLRDQVDLTKEVIADINKRTLNFVGEQRVQQEARQRLGERFKQQAQTLDAIYEKENLIIETMGEAGQQKVGVKQAIAEVDAKRQAINEKINDIKSGYTVNESNLKQELLRTKKDLQRTEKKFGGIAKILDAETPDQVVREIYKDTDSKILSDFVEFHQGREGGEKALDAMRKTVVEKWFSDMYDPATKTLSKIDDFTKPQNGITQTKLGILLGDADTAAKTFNLINKVNKYQQGIFGRNKFIQRGIQHWVYTLPYAMMLHPATLINPGMLALTTVAGVAMSWPKLIDKISKNDKFYDQLINYLDTGATQQATMIAPILAKEYFDEGVTYHIPGTDGSIVNPSNAFELTPAEKEALNIQ